MHLLLSVYQLQVQAGLQAVSGNQKRVEQFGHVVHVRLMFEKAFLSFTLLACAGGVVNLNHCCCTINRNPVLSCIRMFLIRT